MKIAGMAALAASVAATGVTAFGRSGRAPEFGAAITLRVVNEGGVSPGALSAAAKEAMRIFRHSGIELVWLTCESGRAEFGSGHPCNRSFGPSEFWIRIVTQRPAATSEDMLGFSELDEAQARGSAGVYYPAALKLAHKWQSAAGEILGAAIAHEVGHLMLGAGAHCSSGVMRAHWGRAEFQRISTSELNFAPEQTRLLQERIERRRLDALASSFVLQTSLTSLRKDAGWARRAPEQPPSLPREPVLLER